MVKLSWGDVLKRDDLVGGDIETQEDGHVFRGPISKISLNGDYLSIDDHWTAIRTGQGWKKFSGSNSCGTDTKAVSPQDIGLGRVMFTMIGLGVAVIFPKGYHSNIDPSEVEGLDVDERQKTEERTKAA